MKKYLTVAMFLGLLYRAQPVEAWSIHGLAYTAVKPAVHGLVYTAKRGAKDAAKSAKRVIHAATEAVVSAGAVVYEILKHV